ncbi:HET-domain-containing protein [Dichomitus squalens LYAD-421 SS1]|uniref:HET-domain-containing protein n=1 Tax=Dichomitus squalens (strain LYAD-421) TaxID=732165 RepID=R7SL13_DICSQ|nr:HET-domain-containing protein [Dichomitus squalens LYAD-421 SS1]EJF56846.1 HET-domain-containing protein [Dichomitus squalens LYAD-421 SS1]
MWLLHTTRFELKEFPDASGVPGGYAILSHTWGNREQTYQDIRAIAEQCKLTGDNPRDKTSSKIRKCCDMALQHGYEWAWVDSCCINKTSSTELSEAINSMFKWYWQAEVCFAFLVDVPTASIDELSAEGSPFRRSRWHKRGWTLQELIAPAVVIFVSRTWERLGTKAELAQLLEEITHVPQSILTRQRYYYQASVADRMVWASNRVTTRVEDQGYCLMGLFNVRMTIIYGEGSHAFQRLQQKIMKHGFDMSLFAWGAGWLRNAPLRDLGLEFATRRDIELLNDYSYLLAPSPASFIHGFEFTPLHPHPKQIYPPPVLKEWQKARARPFHGVEIPTAAVENYGIVCRFPVFEAGGIVVAVLLCENKSREHMGLLLQRDPLSYDPKRPLHYTSAVFNDTSTPDQQFPLAYRLVSLGDDLYNLRFNGKRVKPRWRTLYVQPRPEALYSPDTSIARLRLNCAVQPAFRIPHWLIANFDMLGFLLTPETPEDELPLRLQLSGTLYGEFIHLDLGICHTGDHWAKVLIHHDDDTSNWNTPHHIHDCTEHHVSSWSEGKKLFGDTATRGVELAFSTCTLASATNPRTLAARIELKGSVYAHIEQQARLLRHGPELPQSIRTVPSIAPASVASQASASLRPSWATFIVSVEHVVSWPMRFVRRPSGSI